MKEKLKDYIEMIFADAPDCLRTRELKEEMYANVCDKYDDLISEGKGEAAAYNISVASIGDISELIDSIKKERDGFVCESDSGDEDDEHDGKEEKEGEVTPAFTFAQQQEIEAYRKKYGVMTAVATAICILCWVPLVLITSILEFNGMNSDVGGIIGITVMMVMIAVASGLFIMRRYMRPAFLKNKKYAKLQKEAQSKTKKHRNPALRIISRIVWVVALAVFLILGFSRGLWHPAWILFPLAIAVDNIVEAIFELCGKKYV